MADKTLLACTELQSTDQAKQRPETHFEPFQWHTESAAASTILGSVAMPFAGLVLDVARGARSILAMIEQAACEEDTEDVNGNPQPRLLSVTEAGVLSRMCISSLTMLGEEADRLIQRANDEAAAAAGFA